MGNIFLRRLIGKSCKAPVRAQLAPLMLVVNEKITKERTMATVLRKKYLKSKKYGNSVEKKYLKRKDIFHQVLISHFPVK